MRSVDEIKNLILSFALSDGRVRAVLLNGSRANPNVKPDKLQDFDVVFIVDNLESFTANHSWTDFFGEKIISQLPEEMNFGEKNNCEAKVGFSYLMIFEDGNRIDLTLFLINRLETDFQADSLTVVWLDKDNLFPNIPPPSDRDYHIQKPTQKEFSDVCNEFWWVSTYVAKGLLRNEITYAHEMLETVVRPMFMNIIKWKIGIEKDFSVSFGKAGKFMEKYLSEDFYQDILQTYSNADIEKIWKALFKMTDIFQQTSIEISRNLNFHINKIEQKKTLNFLRKQYNQRKV